MGKRFKSKIDLHILLPLLLILLAGEFCTIFYNIISGAIAIGIVTAFVIYMCMETKYELTSDDKLKIKSGFLFRQEIYIKSIKKVRPIKDRRTSSALSSDRLEIQYNRYGRVLVSPSHKSEFIRELKEVNPRIRIEE